MIIIKEEKEVSKKSAVRWWGQRGIESFIPCTAAKCVLSSMFLQRTILYSACNPIKVNNRHITGDLKLFCLLRLWSSKIWEQRGWWCGEARIVVPQKCPPRLTAPSTASSMTKCKQKTLRSPVIHRTTRYHRFFGVIRLRNKMKWIRHGQNHILKGD